MNKRQAIAKLATALDSLKRTRERMRPPHQELRPLAENVKSWHANLRTVEHGLNGLRLELEADEYATSKEPHLAEATASRIVDALKRGGKPAPEEKRVDPIEILEAAGKSVLKVAKLVRQRQGHAVGDSTVPLTHAAVEKLLGAKKKARLEQVASEILRVNDPEKCTFMEISKESLRKMLNESQTPTKEEVEGLLRDALPESDGDNAGQWGDSR